MITGRYSSGFRVPALSTSKIRARAMSVRQILLPESDNPDLETFLESLVNFGITYDVVEDSYLPRGVEASCIPEARMIYISQSTFDDICRNEERARFTVFHELGHMLLAHSRSFHRDAANDCAIWENSEWQADQFAAEILMPLDVINARGLRTALQVQQAFGVSFQAASYRLSKLKQKQELKCA